MFTSKENFRKQYLERFKEVTGESFEEGSMQEKYNVLASLIMKYAGTYMADTKSRMDKNNNQKRVYYFSMEYLIGKLLIMNLHNMGIYNIVEDGLKDLGLDIRDLENIETDPGLGHGGLGRLAACFMDSLAFLNIPAVGMGIRYRYGSFQQKIVDGQQVELPNRWLHNEYPWEIKKASKSEIIKFYGKIKVEKIEDRLQFIHEDYEAVTAVPYDIPQIDFDSNDVNYIRLWSAENAYGFDLESFNNGDYLQAVKNKANVEAITHVLYPNDANYNGRLLRLKQQYFFVSAGLKSIIRRYKRNNDNFDKLADKIQIQINDTHPSLVIPELMRILIDEEGLDWDYSWNLVNNVCSYTNHTILTEALEKWPVDMMKKLLPRVYMIIEEINRRFIDNAIPIEKDIKMRNSILRDGVVHMANLSVIGSKSVNGVSKLHSDIIKNETFKELYKLYPWKFNSKTNGVSHRRFLLKANPDLRKFLSEAIGPEWEKDAEKLKDLDKYCQDKDCTEELYQAKRKNKERLAKYIKENQNIDINVDSIFDIHIKRIHEYKRQLLNVLHIIHLYDKIKNEGMEIYPRTFIFSGKAAPSYTMAKKIIRLINSLADIVNKDGDVNKYLKVVFLENFNVSLAEILYPAADVSEQISTASKEASGTGNMKFMMNGALTIGTLDGANVEIAERVGEDNIFLFGLKSEEVINYYNNGGYCSFDVYNNNPDLKKVVNHLVDGFFYEDIGEFDEIYDNLVTHNDTYFVLKDFESYMKAQKKLEKTYKDRKLWFDKTLKNISESGYFSSDRTIMDYDRDIWKVKNKK
jgi:starch phosphorylase